MAAFGKRGGGGRRRACRNTALVPATLTTVSRSRSVVLENISSTGVRLRGEDLPALGDGLVLKLDRLEVFGIVKWVCSELCGVAFDSPLGEREVEQIRAETQIGMLTRLTPEERLAMQHWATGFAR